MRTDRLVIIPLHSPEWMANMAACRNSVTAGVGVVNGNACPHFRRVGSVCSVDEQSINHHALRGTCPADRQPHRKAPSPTHPARGGRLPVSSRLAVAYSLFLQGNPAKHHTYTTGAEVNADMLPLVYPGWSMIVYHDDSVPVKLLAMLRDRGAILENMPRSVGVSGALWRFRAAVDPRFDRVLFRDIDSIITPREVDSVNEWIASGQPFHATRELSIGRQLARWPHGAFRPIQAGTWGARAGNLPTLLSDLEAWPNHADYFQDELFLAAHVWPRFAGRSIIHSVDDDPLRTHGFRVSNPRNIGIAVQVRHQAWTWHPAMRDFKPSPIEAWRDPPTKESSMFTPQLMDPWSTHLPLLAKAVGLTTGPVLEIGCGMYSTLVLDGICRGRRLVSLESNPQWSGRFAHLASSDHKFVFGNYDDADTLIRETPWSVVLIDHAPGERRQVDAAKVTHAQLVIFHDTESKGYGYDKVLPLFKRRYTDKRLRPWSTVATNSDDPALGPMFPTLDD